VSATNLDGEDLITVQSSDCGEAWQTLGTQHNIVPKQHNTKHHRDNLLTDKQNEHYAWYTPHCLVTENSLSVIWETDSGLHYTADAACFFTNKNIKRF